MCIRDRLKTVGKFKVYCTQSTFYMEPEEEDVDMDLAFDRVSKVCLLYTSWRRCQRAARLWARNGSMT